MERKIKAVFFDIDGTILSHTIKDVPTGTRKALDQLKENNIFRIVATGRHMNEINRLPVCDITFDAYITLNGQICMDALGEVFFENPIADIEEILRLFREKNVPVMLVEKERMYINFINEDVVMAHQSISTPLPDVMEYTGNTLYQAIIYVKRDKEAAVTKNLKNVEITRWNECGIDLVAEGGTKVTGIEKYMDMKGYCNEEIAAFGDGENDLEMLRFAKNGIAMGNASELVKAVASYVTDDVDSDGIKKGLEYLGLI